MSAGKEQFKIGFFVGCFVAAIAVAGAYQLSRKAERQACQETHDVYRCSQVWLPAGYVSLADDPELDREGTLVRLSAIRHLLLARWGTRILAMNSAPKPSTDLQDAINHIDAAQELLDEKK